MQSIIRCEKMKKKLAANSNSKGNNCDGAKPKERHIVSWSQEVLIIMLDWLVIVLFVLVLFELLCFCIAYLVT